MSYLLVLAALVLPRTPTVFSFRTLQDADSSEMLVLDIRDLSCTAGGVIDATDHSLASTRWRILQNCKVFRSAEF